MENNKFWIYLGLGVVAALSLKWFSSPESTVASKRWSIQANMSDEISYKRSAKANERVAGLSGARRSTLVLTEVKSGATTAAPAVAAKKQDVKAKNIAKKKDDKKKKKKKKKSKVIGVPETDSLSDDNSESEVAAVPVSSGASAPLAFAGAGQAGASPVTDLTDWEKLLLVTPNHRETTRFINLYQTKQVTAEVFYGIVGQMLNDGRTQMRSLGVMALGATPSVQSYELLVMTSDNETGPVKTQAATYLERTYNRPHAINVLYGVLVKADASAPTQLQALKNLSALISNLRKPSSINEETGETVTASQTQSTNQQHVLRYFVLLQKNVMPLLTQSQDPEVRNLALSVSSLLIAATGATDGASGPLQTAQAG